MQCEIVDVMSLPSGTHNCQGACFPYLPQSCIATQCGVKLQYDHLHCEWAFPCFGIPLLWHSLCFGIPYRSSSSSVYEGIYPKHISIG